MCRQLSTMSTLAANGKKRIAYRIRGQIKSFSKKKDANNSLFWFNRNKMKVEY